MQSLSGSRTHNRCLDTEDRLQIKPLLFAANQKNYSNMQKKL